jgi:alpha-N-arabinofuranosidase
MNKLLKNCALSLCLGISATTLFANEKVAISLDRQAESSTIAPEIYGQFAEHLGTCIYGGLWVGPESTIPNTNGYRNDVLQALRDLKVPVLRWPGGCFADEYHWQDGIGPKENRPRMVNNNWGGTVEDNSFGTHEFFNLCELLGCEPYLSGNVGSGSVEELAKWVEYITAEDGPMAKLRKENGREQPWHLKYLGVGNESWGCGGSMFPEYYANLYRRYSNFCRNFNDNKLYKIASGASDYDYNWTKVLMDKARYNMDGISLHYYSICDWNNKGDATKFSDDDYYITLGKCLEIEEVLKNHIKVMDEYDPQKRVGLLVDEWGTWWNEEAGTVRGHLYQQNTMRDAMVAALSLNVFHKFTDRVRMTNIAQIANVLQSMVLTRGDKMILTPTYYVFKMYRAHQGAKFVPLDFICSTRQVKSERSDTPRNVPVISATASQKDGILTISLANTDLSNDFDIEIPINLKNAVISGEILTSANIDDYNDFDHPSTITLKDFNKAKLVKDTIKLTIPAKSIITLTIK